MLFYVATMPIRDEALSIAEYGLLSQVFAIDVCAYAIMSNHYHLVLHVDNTTAESWSDEEVAQRWTTLYKAPLLVTRWLKWVPTASAVKSSASH
ncbi:hypothetical protein ACPV4B_12055 [Vibrio parahaemolyticus]